jgi:hypothetical protein
MMEDYKMYATLTGSFCSVEDLEVTSSVLEKKQVFAYAFRTKTFPEITRISHADSTS